MYPELTLTDTTRDFLELLPVNVFCKSKWAKEVEVTVNPIDKNNVIGHKKENIKKLKDTYDVDLKIKEDKKVKQGKSKIEITKTFE